MRSKATLLAAMFILAACLALAPARPVSAQGAPAWAQGAEHSGKVVVPDSSVERPEDVGRRAHTNHVIFLRGKGGGGVTIPTPSGETPSSLGCVYQIVESLTTGCPVRYDNSMPSPSGGGGVIAIVDAYDYATAENDLNVFASQFGIPPCTTAGGCFKVVYASGRKPKSNCGWGQEAALDIEWAHAMAPNAKIILVEANSNSFSDLFAAVDVAFNEVICGKATTCPGNSSGYGQVSMSWGGSEFSGEPSYDSHFNKAGVVFFAASGDTGGKTIYPGTSPYVVSAGGTTVNRDSNGHFSGETAWSGSGGGPSTYEPRPSYQDVIMGIVGSRRGAPDFSFDANPSTGVSVYDSTSCQGLSGWLTFGGTSVSSPSLAGIVNLLGSRNSTSTNELIMIYGNLGSTSNINDITSGSAGSYSAAPGWDFVTGVGSNKGFDGK